MKKLIIVLFMLTSVFSFSNSRTESLISSAYSKLGSRYSYGSKGPYRFDCSGFTYYLFRKYGAYVPRTSSSQSRSGRRVSRGNLERGDLVFFDTSRRGRVNHVGIYLGNNRFIHASSGKNRKVVVSPLNKGFYRNRFKWGVKNPLA